MTVVIFASVSASFAYDDNGTGLNTAGLEDNAAELSNSSETLCVSDDDSLCAEYSDDANETSTIETGKVTKRYNNAVEYSATFFDENKTPLKNTIVFCGLDSILYGVNATTDSNGIASFLIPASNGVHSLYLINPVSFDVTNDTIKVFDVLKGNKDFNVYFNSGKSYTVRVYGDDGKPVKANQKVTITVNLKKSTVKTDKNGYAKLKINFQPGSYIVTAQYKNFMVVNKINIKPTIIPLTQFGAKKLSKTFKYKVKLLNNKGKILKNKKIKVKFNKKTYTAKTNKKGIATFTLKTPAKTGKFNIVSSYGKATATAQMTRYVIK